MVDDADAADAGEVIYLGSTRKRYKDRNVGGRNTFVILDTPEKDSGDKGGNSVDFVGTTFEPFFSLAN